MSRVLTSLIQLTCGTAECGCALHRIAQGGLDRLPLLDAAGLLLNNSLLTPESRKEDMHRSIEHPALSPLKQRFPDAKLLVTEFRAAVTVAVPRENIRDIATFLRDDP